MQEVDRTVTRARRNTIGDAIRRSAARSAKKKGKLADFKRPKHFFFVEDLPRNAAGKILKRELRGRFAPEGGE